MFESFTVIFLSFETYIEPAFATVFVIDLCLVQLLSVLEITIAPKALTDSGFNFICQPGYTEPGGKNVLSTYVQLEEVKGDSIFCQLNVLVD